MEQPQPKRDTNSAVSEDSLKENHVKRRQQQAKPAPPAKIPTPKSKPSFSPSSKTPPTSGSKEAAFALSNLWNPAMLQQQQPPAPSPANKNQNGLPSMPHPQLMAYPPINSPPSAFTWNPPQYSPAQPMYHHHPAAAYAAHAASPHHAASVYRPPPPSPAHGPPHHMASSPPPPPLGAPWQPPPHSMHPSTNNDSEAQRMQAFMEATRTVTGFTPPPPTPGAPSSASGKFLPPPPPGYHYQVALARGATTTTSSTMPAPPPPPPSGQKRRKSSDKALATSDDDKLSLVTPTPKKLKTATAIVAAIRTARKTSPGATPHAEIIHEPNPPPSSIDKNYSRKTKSLGVLCENFCQQDWASIDYKFCIDQMARDLGVERRRIYDIVNILESLEIIKRQRKNTYEWKGFDKIHVTLGDLQQEGFRDFATLARHYKLDKPGPTASTTTTSMEKKSLGKLSRQFLQLFLVGHPVLNLSEASDFILGHLSVTEFLHLDGSKKANAPVNKTKIRRLYDIANVLQALDFITKTDTGRRTKPTFSWSYFQSPKVILQDYKERQRLQAHLLWSPSAKQASGILATLTGTSAAQWSNGKQKQAAPKVPVISQDETRLDKNDDEQSLGSSLLPPPSVTLESIDESTTSTANQEEQDASPADKSALAEIHQHGASMIRSISMGGARQAHH